MKKKEKNIKIVPTEEGFWMKAISDLTYGYLQTISYVKVEGDKKISFVYKTPTLVSEVSKATKINARTVRRKIDKLVESGYIYEDNIIDLYGNEVDAYIFKSKDLKYQAINKDVLNFLIDTTNENVIKVYAYLLNKQLWSKEKYNKDYEFSKKELITTCLGMSNDKHNRDHEIIGNILDLLQLSGLLVLYDKRVLRNITGGGFTSYYKIYEVNEKVKKPTLKKNFGTVKTRETREFLGKLDNGDYDGLEF